jgi:hypothetical protein
VDRFGSRDTRYHRQSYLQPIARDYADDAALYSNTTASDNTATGYQALQSNTTGPRNTANGFQALVNNTIGYNNTAVGYQALVNNTTGTNNVALGTLAGENLTTGSNNNIDIGSRGIAGESQTIRIGNVQTRTFIAGIHGVTVTGTAVVVNSSGQLGVAPSSQRFKAEIKPMDKASEAILALKPVTFRYKKELDPGGIPQFGLVAEQVEKVNPDLVVRDAEGKVFTVRYEAVNAMLLNEFLKEHHKIEEQGRKVQEQEATIRQLSSVVAEQQKVFTARLKEQDSKIRAVNERHRCKWWIVSRCMNDAAPKFFASERPTPGESCPAPQPCPESFWGLIFLIRSLPLSHPRPSGHAIYVAASQLAPFSLTISTPCY